MEVADCEWQYALLVVQAAWVVDNALVSINKVALHSARLVLRWTTILAWVNHFGM